VIERRSLAVPWDKPKALEREIAALNLSTLQGLVLEAVLVEETRDMYQGFPEALDRACRAYGVPLKGILTALEMDGKNQKGAKAAAEPAPGRTSGAKAKRGKAEA
jgi:hypothetical protein